MLCSIGFIAKHYGVSPSTIRRWVKLGYIRIAGRTFGGHRRFDVREARCEEVIEDIGSGLNCSKPGLRSLLRQLLDGHVKKLSVVHEDRLLRFGVGLIRQICRRMRTEVDVLENRAEKTFEEGLARDVITLMTVFCARLYGRRSHRNKQSVKVPACATKMADRHEATGRDVPSDGTSSFSA